MSTSERTRVRDVQSAAQARSAIRAERCAGHTVGLVPTMGSLHEGHLSLIRAGRAENGLVVTSIFVNPTQFGPTEDYTQYPRDLARDRELAEAAGTDILFAPSVSEMYPDGDRGQQVWVDPGPLAAHLCGASRPGHFRGVATVVAKLFAMLEPDRAYFGGKDAQQAAIVRQMARDLGFPVEVRVIPTVREADGLALSSRNVYLTERERAQAPALHRALDEAARSVAGGERDAEQVERGMREYVAREAPDASIDYASVVDAGTLQPLGGPIDRPVLLAVAAYFGRTRLIDNVTASP